MLKLLKVTWEAERWARRAFPSWIRFLFSAFFFGCSRWLSFSDFSSHSWKAQTSLKPVKDLNETKPACRDTDTFFLLARMRLRTVWLACCLLVWRLYQRWIIIAAWFTCWINLHTKHNCCDSPLTSTAEYAPTMGDQTSRPPPRWPPVSAQQQGCRAGSLLVIGC